MTASFPELVRDKFTPLLTAHAFTVIEETPYEVVLESPFLQAVAMFDPRGELDVRVFPKGSENWEGFSYSGMVGGRLSSDCSRSLWSKCRADPRILGADAGFYGRLAAERRLDAEAWTAYYGGKAPRPGRDRP